jgi:hypothetical protein
MSNSRGSIVLVAGLALVWLICWVLLRDAGSPAQKDSVGSTARGVGALRTESPAINDKKFVAGDLRREAAPEADGSIVVTVKDEAGGVVAGADASWVARIAAVYVPGDLRLLGSTDSVGRFSVGADRIPVGASLVIAKPGYVTQAVRIMGPKSYGVVLAASAPLRVKAVGEDGMPLQDVVIVAYEKSAIYGILQWQELDFVSGFSELACCCSGRTGADGYATLHLPARHFSVAAFARDRVMTSVPESADMAVQGGSERQVVMAMLAGVVWEFVDQRGEPVRVIAQKSTVAAVGAQINNVFAKMRRTSIRKSIAGDAGNRVVVLDSSANRPIDEGYGTASVSALVDGYGVVRAEASLARWDLARPVQVMVGRDAGLLGALQIDGDEALCGVAEDAVAVIGGDAVHGMVWRPRCGMKYTVPVGDYQIVRLHDRKVIKVAHVRPNDESGAERLAWEDLGPHLNVVVKTSSGEEPFGCEIVIQKDGESAPQRFVPSDPSRFVVPLEPGIYSVVVSCGGIRREFGRVQVVYGLAKVDCLLES